MPMFRPDRLLGILLVVLLSAASALGSDCPPASPSPLPSPLSSRDFTSSQHGYQLHLPPGWELAPDPNGVADTRFRRTTGAPLSGSYQVFEGALWTTPAAWYEVTKSRYQEVAGKIPTVARLEFEPLHPARMGGQSAHVIRFRTWMKSGVPIRTTITFTPRPSPRGTDVHELIVIGEPEAFAQGARELEGLQADIRYSPASR